MGQFFDECLVVVDLLVHGLDCLAQSVDLVVERLDTLHQLRS